MSNVFTILPIVASAGSLPTIPPADIDYFVDYELDAREHWIFGGAAASLVGLKSAGALVPQATDHSFTANSVILNSTYNHGLVSSIADAAEQTMVVVVKRVDYTAAAKAQIMCGTLVSSGVDLLGSGIYGNNVDNKVLFNQRPQTDQMKTSFPVGLDVGEYAFIAFSEKAPAATPRSVLSYIGGGTVTSIVGPVQKNIATRNLAVGNAYYNNAGFSGGPEMEVAEFIVYDRALSAAEMVALYAKRKAILAKRGVFVS
ncbi:hypothetical protein [Azonexus sp.]|uniref:hypothetical protein n=1 Tax=Azonexus sp. TaxID=1872668 RepID=UPI0035B1CF39